MKTGLELGGPKNWAMSVFEDSEIYRSPLWMVTKDPYLTELVTSLQQQCRELQKGSESAQVLVFSQKKLAEVREAFAAVIRRGESRLHRLCSLFCCSFFPALPPLGTADDSALSKQSGAALNASLPRRSVATQLEGRPDGAALKNIGVGFRELSYEIGSVVIGQVGPGRERFTLVQNLSHEELFELTDLDLGQRQLRKLKILEGDVWKRPDLVANFVEYQPRELDWRGIHKITSRIKAEEAIWNKVVDEMFSLDDLVQQDKQLAHLSRYVKDIFGLKVVTADVAGARKFHASLATHRFDTDLLEQLGIPKESSTSALEIIETKDYIDGDPKRSGWKAIKSVIGWGGDTFELQVQPLRSYLQERERLSQESHLSFKNRRDELRRQIAAENPLYAFYGALLQWLFLQPDSPPPSFDGVTVVLGP